MSQNTLNASGGLEQLDGIKVASLADIPSWFIQMLSFVQMTCMKLPKVPLSELLTRLSSADYHEEANRQARSADIEWLAAAVNEQLAHQGWGFNPGSGKLFLDRP